MDKINASLSGEDKSTVENIKNDVMDITFALQFQDITSQKLEHANRILDAINTKFSQLSANSEMIKVKTKVGEKIMHELKLGPNSEKAKSESKAFQRDTEDVIREDQSFSQDDIDALFN